MVLDTCIFVQLLTHTYTPFRHLSKALRGSPHQDSPLTTQSIGQTGRADGFFIHIHTHTHTHTHTAPCKRSDSEQRVSAISASSTFRLHIFFASLCTHFAFASLFHTFRHHIFFTILCTHFAFLIFFATFFFTSTHLFCNCSWVHDQ